MEFIFKGLALAAVVFIGGCNENIYHPLVYLNSGEHPLVYLGSGILVQINDSETATVFGYDNCPDSANWIFETIPSKTGCTKLMPNSTVNVQLILKNGVVSKEKWIVTYDSNRYTLTRPNGFNVRAATKASVA